MTDLPTDEEVFSRGAKKNKSGERTVDACGASLFYWLEMPHNIFTGPPRSGVMWARDNTPLIKPFSLCRVGGPPLPDLLPLKKKKKIFFSRHHSSLLVRVFLCSAPFPSTLA